MEDKQRRSCWMTGQAPDFPPLSGDESAEAVIVGGGLCGLLTAYELLQKGKNNLVLLEAEDICSGVSAYTTAKITSQHRLIYRNILDSLGKSYAEEYAAANQQAVARFWEIAAAEDIGCDLAACDAIVYARTEEGAKLLKKELEAARELKLPAEPASSCELPFPVKSALCFHGQARFHPLKFAYRLAEVLQQRGVRIYGHTRALRLEGLTVDTDRGKARGEAVILCTHYPFVNFPGLYFAKIIQSRSYVLALSGPSMPDAMYIDCDEDGYSVRGHQDEAGQLLLFGGCGHKSGHEQETDHYAELRQAAERYYPGAQVKYAWSAQDCMTHDKIPYIGRLRQAGDHVYIASGFNKWGMTGSMAAAGILSDLVAAQNGRYRRVFSPDRPDAAMQAGSFLKESTDTAANFVKGYLRIPEQKAEELKNGEGGIVSWRGKRAGAYRDEAGKFHVVGPVCTHMLCPLNWNQDERTWDCPCHGSRFDIDGAVLGNPAVEPLERYEIEKA